jgi:hypothetical protein
MVGIALTVTSGRAQPTGVPELLHPGPVPQPEKGKMAS